MSTTLDPSTWPSGDYDRLLADQHLVRSEAGYAEGKQGAITVAYGGLAARAGLEALKSGGNAIDAALTTAMMQVAITGGGPVSYFGIQSLVYYDAKTRKVHCMNAEWNTVLGEDDALSIPGGVNMSSMEGLRGAGPASGRTAMVGGFMKGVEAAHKRFGKLPFASIFKPSIYAAEHGIPINAGTAEMLALRTQDLARLPETRATLKKADGSDYKMGDTLKQPALAKTLRAVAEQGADYMYKGPWGRKLAAAVQADGGKMTIEDLERYEVIWSDPLVGQVDGYEIRTSPAPNGGGIGLVEAQLLARAAGLPNRPHWTESGESLRDIVKVAQMLFLDYLPDSVKQQLYPGLDFGNPARLDPARAKELWARMEAGVLPFKFASPMHSDDVVAIDGEGNIAAITHSSNNVMWGRTAINVDGISISDSASFQQAQIARVAPGSRLPAPTETGIVFKDGEPILGFASMGAGLHHRTLQALLNLTLYGKSLREAVDTPDFFGCGMDVGSGEATIQVPRGKFPPEVLKGSGVRFVEIDTEGARFGSEGIWVGISRDPATGLLQAVSHNRNNSAAFAY
jgi:gamma-glutamyltranspeptidase / glutathione hydrolase